MGLNLREKRNLMIMGAKRRPILLDIIHFVTGFAKPVIIFSHGFKGFKDWGHFNLVAKAFAEQGFVFVKYNFSHNGTTSETPTEFSDLNAFGENNFSIELEDLDRGIEWITEEQLIIPRSEVDLEQIYLLGHSRGGATTLIKASENEKIKKAATWSSISSLYRYEAVGSIEDWKKTGVVHIENERTNQQMPLHFQLYEDLVGHPERLNIKKAVESSQKPMLFVHGKNDESVPLEEGVELSSFNPKSTLKVISEGDHSFGGKHPWKSDELPDDTLEAIDITTEFFFNQDE
jgi:dipeptidyl aminopeptidase/acylaminoacyl peptidase